MEKSRRKRWRLRAVKEGLNENDMVVMVMMISYGIEEGKRIKELRFYLNYDHLCINWLKPLRLVTLYIYKDFFLYSPKQNKEKLNSCFYFLPFSHLQNKICRIKKLIRWSKCIHRANMVLNTRKHLYCIWQKLTGMFHIFFFSFFFIHISFEIIN